MCLYVKSTNLLDNMISSLFFFKQKTAYEMRISEWSSDVCSSDLERILDATTPRVVVHQAVALVFETDAGTIRDRRDCAAPGRARHRFHRQMVDRHRPRAPSQT